MVSVSITLELIEGITWHGICVWLGRLFNDVMELGIDRAASFFASGLTTFAPIVGY